MYHTGHRQKSVTVCSFRNSNVSSVVRRHAVLPRPELGFQEKQFISSFDIPVACEQVFFYA